MLKQLIHSDSKNISQNDNAQEIQDKIFQSQWCIPLIQGYYGAFDYVQKQNFKIFVYLICRRSKYRSGTRFYNRGIDENGRCANFIQTEIALLFNDSLFSFKYYTGSVPLFWQQISQLSKVKITRDRQFANVSFKKHIKTLIKQSQHIVLINLLQKKKENEYLLIKQYQNLVQNNLKQFQQTVRYVYFDINYHDKNNTPQKIWQVLQELFPLSQCFKYFQVNLKTNIIYSTQKGTYRISCLDCLARTNRFLEVLAFQAIFMILEKINFFKQSFKELCLQLLLGVQEKMVPFLRYYKTVWQQKTEFQSIIYAGTVSTQGKKTKLLDKIQNTIISLQRYYNQKFIDQVKQRSLDAILYHKNYQPLFRAKHKIPFQISIFTWNANATDPQKIPDLHKHFKVFQSSDLIVIGIQQMIQLSTNNVMNDNTQQSKQSQKWKDYFQSILSNNSIVSQQYVFVQKLQMVGLFLIMFISKKWLHSLKSVHKDLVKTGIKIGYSQKYGNKGGLIIRISIYETTLSFVCAHLAAHQDKVKQRINDIQEIHQKAFQQNKESIQNELEIDFSDYKFFFGDMNFRLDGEFLQIKNTIQNITKESPGSQSHLKALDELIQRDQLYNLMNFDNQNIQDILIDYLKLYRQSAITFLPTYKLDKHTGQYTQQKGRNPSYCDRILFWKTQLDELHIQQKQYKDLRIKGSDHRPVYGRFIVNILKQNRKQSQSIILQQSYAEYVQDSQIKQTDNQFKKIEFR